MLVKSIRNKKTAFSALLLILTFQGFSQLSDFDLSKYKVPDYRYKELNLNFDLSGSSSYRNTNNNALNDTRTSFSVREQNSAGYTYFNNSRKNQRMLFMNGTLDFQNQNSALNFNDTADTKYHSSAGGFLVNISDDNKFYYKPERYFGYTAGLYTNSAFNSSGETMTPNLIDRKLTSYNGEHRVSASVYTGWGRIEETRYAMFAVYMLHDLKNKGLLKMEPTDQQILDIAETIGKVLNKRNFDTRLKLIRELTEVDSVLKATGLMDGNNITYFTILNDNWQYANSPSRPSGSRIQGGLTGSYSYQISKTKETSLIPNPDSLISDDTHKEYGPGYGIEVEMNYGKPISIQWQKAVNATLRIGKTDKTANTVNLLNPETTIFTGTPALQFSLGYSLGYYPNTRTYFIAGIYESASLSQIKTDSTKTENYSSSTSCKADAYYYLSPRVRLQGQAQLSYNYYNSKNPAVFYSVSGNGINFSVSGSLVYMIF